MSYRRLIMAMDPHAARQMAEMGANAARAGAARVDPILDRGGRVGVDTRFGAPMRVLVGSRGGKPVARVVRDGRTIVHDGQSLPHPMSELYTAVTVVGGGASAVPVAGPTDIAVVDVWGALVSAEADAFNWWGDRIGTPYGMIRAGLVAALMDPMVAGVVLRIDSPGGEAVGATPAANELFDLAFGDGEKVNAGSGLSGRNGTPSRGGKPIVAFAEGMMASAALYVGAQAHAVLTSPAAWTGSIGTIITWTDYSRLLDRIGITTNVVKNPAHKDTFTDTRPMEAADRARVQAMVDTWSGQFMADLGRGRRVGAAKVREWVDQMYFVGGQAARAGLADGVVNGLEGAIRAAWAMRKK